MCHRRKLIGVLSVGVGKDGKFWIGTPIVVVKNVKRSRVSIESLATNDVILQYQQQVTSFSNVNNKWRHSQIQQQVMSLSNSTTSDVILQFSNKWRHSPIRQMMTFVAIDDCRNRRN